MKKTMEQARELLVNVTPLNTDCGLLCEHACCRPAESTTDMVWLFPEEETAPYPWGEVVKTQMPVTQTPVSALKCSSYCTRENRPFQCMIFPLVPFYSKKKNAWSVRMDSRAYMVCPLCGYGKKALLPQFVENAEKAVRLLASTEKGERFLQALASEESAYRISL